MAKELPYFKFEPGAWDTGKIQLCVPEVRAVFIDLCSMYWQRLGDLPYKLAVQKICAGNATALDSLYEEGIIKINDGLICIDFLNEQLAEFENLSSKNAENARLGWEKRRKDATAVPLHSDPNAIREEKRRLDEIKEDNINGAAEPLTPKLTVDERKKMFGEKCSIHLDEFGQVMLREFFNYWTEISEGGRKMRFEKEKTWELHKRLLKWKENSIKFSKNGKSGQQTDNHTKNTLDLMEGFKRRNADIFEGGQV